LFDNYEEISSRLDSAFAWSTESIQWNNENQKYNINFLGVKCGSNYNRELAELLPRMVEQISQYTASPNAGLLNTDYTAANEQMDSLIMKISHLHRQLKNVQSKQ
jgi:hypothetical protein